MITCVTSHWIFYSCILLAGSLSLIPIIGKFINVLNTMVHESGHAVVALLTGGGVMNIKLSADTSGAAQTKSKYWIGKVLTSIAGYPISALTAWLLFWLIQVHKTKYVYYLLISLILINLILWVRNTFGIIWLIVMGSLCAIIYLYCNDLVQYYFASFCAAVILFQSLYSTFTLLFIAIKTPAKAGDAKNLKEFTYIPTAIWALLLLAIVIYANYNTFFLLPCMQ
ncbi:MAG TPA: M50 family metallopeptidase [Bacteroidia bacterium]|nr:M50 family metallopeptidase [Bacteroidia bacterium]